MAEKDSLVAMRERHSKMAEKRASQNSESIRAGIYARVSTNNQQTIRPQICRPAGLGAGGRSCGRRRAAAKLM
jgi:hypothetical protein